MILLKSSQQIPVLNEVDVMERYYFGKGNFRLGNDQRSKVCVRDINLFCYIYSLFNIFNDLMLR